VLSDDRELPDDFLGGWAATNGILLWSGCVAAVHAFRPSALPSALATTDALLVMSVILLSIGSCGIVAEALRVGYQWLASEPNPEREQLTEVPWDE